MQLSLCGAEFNRKKNIKIVPIEREKDASLLLCDASGKGKAAGRDADRNIGCVVCALPKDGASVATSE